MASNLLDRRRNITTERAQFRAGQQAPSSLNPDVVTSWERCADQLSTSAVTDSRNIDADALWSESPIRDADGVVAQLGELAKAEGYLAAITSRRGEILWVDGSVEMLRQAEHANFVPGADWSEAAAGTNAPCLSLDLDRPTAVFSAEHWCEPVHDWVCYAAPIHDKTGAVVGCVDLSSTWDRATSMASVVVSSIAQQIDDELRRAATPVESAERGIHLKLMGKPRLMVDGVERSLPPRQIEILAALALRPDGLSLSELTYHVYGDRPVSTSTVKSEVSHLRAALGGAIQSRPYRLAVPVEVDVLQIYQSTRGGDLGLAAGAYVDQLMPRSEAPLLVDERYSLDVALRSALLQRGSVADLLCFAKVNPFDRQILEVAQARIADAPSLQPELHAAWQRLGS